jgi:hypothetical protein
MRLHFLAGGNIKMNISNSNHVNQEYNIEIHEKNYVD